MPSTGTHRDSPPRSRTRTSRRHWRWSANCPCPVATSCTWRWAWPACSPSGPRPRSPATGCRGWPGCTSPGPPPIRAAGCRATRVARRPACCSPTGAGSPVPGARPAARSAGSSAGSPPPARRADDHRRRRAAGRVAGPAPGRSARPRGAARPHRDRLSAHLRRRPGRGELDDRRPRRPGVSGPRDVESRRRDRRRPAPAGRRHRGGLRGGRAGHRVPVRAVRLQRGARTDRPRCAVPGAPGLADDGLALVGARRAAGPGPSGTGGVGRRDLRRLGRRPRSAAGAGGLLDLGAPEPRAARHRHGTADQPGRLAARRGGADDGARRPRRPHLGAGSAADRRRGPAPGDRLDDPGRRAGARRMAGSPGFGGMGRGALPSGPRRARAHCPTVPVRPVSRPVRVLAGLSVAGALHAALNIALLRRAPDDPPPVTRPVTVVLPVRDEEDQVGGCLTALLDQRGVADLRVQLVEAGPPPPGWLGKPHACAVGAQVARAGDAGNDGVLAFVDADVRLFPDALAGAVAVLDAHGLSLVSPWPRPVARGPAERLVQPLVPWLWATTLPVRVAERSRRPSLAAATGQFLVLPLRAYERAGGHGAVKDEVLEDIALLRAVKRSGGSGGPVDGSRLAACRMYDGWPALRDGYAKSLWGAVGGSPAASVLATAVLTAVWVVPPLATLRGSRAGLLGYLAGVAGRAVTAAGTGGRVWPDALAHPVSMVLLDVLMVRSVAGHRRGTLTWRGRRLPRQGTAPPAPQQTAPATIGP